MPNRNSLNATVSEIKTASLLVHLHTHRGMGEKTNPFGIAEHLKEDHQLFASHRSNVMDFLEKLEKRGLVEMDPELTGGDHQRVCFRPTKSGLEFLAKGLAQIEPFQKELQDLANNIRKILGSGK